MANADIKSGATAAMNYYMGAQREQFKIDSGGGGGWKDLAPSTKMKRYYEAGGRFKREKGVTHAMRLQYVATIPFPILYITGEFYTSLTPGEPLSYVAQTQDSLKTGTSWKWASTHYYGNPPRLPARRFLHDPEKETLSVMGSAVTQGYRAMFERAAADSSPTGSLV